MPLASLQAAIKDHQPWDIVTGMARGTPVERFFEKVQQSEDCWQWIGGKKAAGYGQFAVDGRKVIAHRWSYGHFVGPIPNGYEIDHLCRNRGCVNPQHLEAVSVRENRDRRIAAKTHCVHGHAYTPENTRMQRGADGYVSRVCRSCERAKNRRRYLANR